MLKTNVNILAIHVTAALDHTVERVAVNSRDIIKTCMNCKEMTKAELDLVILANLNARR